MKLKFNVGLTIATVLAMNVTLARADILYGTDGATGNLIKIDSVTGASSVIGNMGIGNGIGIAIDASTGVAYARNFSHLYEVNLGTGSTTLVGPSGSGITALAFDAAFSTLYSVDQNTNALYKVNPATGAATLIGNTGISTPLDLSTNSAGVLYGASLGGGIYTINQSTGAATQLFASVDSRGLTAISFDASDNLFGVTLTGDELVRINLGSGTTTNIGGPVVALDVRGLDFNRGLAPVPEPSSVLLLAAIVGIAGFTQRKKHAYRRQSETLR